MNFIKKGIVAMMFLALVGTFANAQENNFSNSVIVGIGTPLLDGGRSLHIGYNPRYSLSEKFAIEGQLSYLHTKITGAFLSGETGKNHTANVLVGPRFYFNRQDKKVRPYLNLLVGGVYLKEINDNRSNPMPEFVFGFSSGAYVDINQFTLGLSYDMLGYLILKAGYTF